MRTHLSAGVLVAVAGHAWAQCPAHHLLVSGDPQPDVYHGKSVAIDTGYVVVGVPDQMNGGFPLAGEVCTYESGPGNNWQIAAYMNPDVPSPTARFGTSVAVGGSHTWAVVGAPGEANSGGAAYIFQRDPQGVAWTQYARLFPGFDTGECFGASVAMNREGTVVAVGAPLRNAGQLAWAGGVLVYSRPGAWWVYTRTLFQGDASLLHAYDHYGQAVAADGERIVVGVPYGDMAGLQDCGYVSVWTRSGGAWTAANPLYPGDVQANDLFGYSVAMRGDLIAVGAPNATASGLSFAGAVYVYRYQAGAWVLDGKLLPTDNFPSLEFGWTVGIDGDRVVVGTGGVYHRTYVFRRAGGQWLQDARYKTPSGIESNWFGNAVAIEGGNVVAGAPGLDRPSWHGAGGAYVIEAPTEASDTFAAARQVPMGTYYGCTDHCTIDGSTTCGNGSPQGPDAWYRFTAPSSGMLTVDTLGSTVDTVLSVHSDTGTFGSGANTLVCSDDFALPQTWSRVTLPVTAGQSLVIRVAGYGASVGAYTLHIGPLLIGIGCYANCDGSTAAPVLNVSDFSCFLNRFAAADPYANCDNSTTAPTLNVADFACFLNSFGAGCT